MLSSEINQHVVDRLHEGMLHTQAYRPNIKRKGTTNLSQWCSKGMQPSECHGRFYFNYLQLT